MLERLKQLRKTLKLNQVNFAKQLGITQTSYSAIESGVNPLTNKYIKMICVIFDVSENWLRTGEGSMFGYCPYIKKLKDIVENLNEQSKEYLLLMAEELMKLQKSLIDSKNK